MSYEEAMDFFRRQQIQHNDPQRCAIELINQAMSLYTSGNLTAIVVHFSPRIEPPKPWHTKCGFRESAQHTRVDMLIKHVALKSLTKRGTCQMGQTQKVVQCLYLTHVTS